MEQSSFQDFVSHVTGAHSVEEPVVLGAGVVELLSHIEMMSEFRRLNRRLSIRAKWLVKFGTQRRIWHNRPAEREQWRMTWPLVRHCSRFD